MLHSANMSSCESPFDFFPSAMSLLNTGLDKFNLPCPIFWTCNCTCAQFYSPNQTHKNGRAKPKFASYRETSGNIPFNFLPRKHYLGFLFKSISTESFCNEAYAIQVAT